MCGWIRKDRARNEVIRKKVDVKQIDENIRKQDKDGLGIVNVNF